MTISLKHNFVSPVTDAQNPDEVGPDEWNAEHNLTLATNRLIGRDSTGSGDAEEISVTAPVAFSGSGSLQLDGTTAEFNTALSDDDFATLTNTVTLTNKTLTAPDINGGTADALTSLGVRSTGTGSFDLQFQNTENLTANRALAVTTGDAARSLTLQGNPTLDDWFDQSVKTTASPSFVNQSLSGYTDLSEIATPADPSADTARLYAFAQGSATRMAFRDAGGNETVINGDLYEGNTFNVLDYIARETGGLVELHKIIAGDFSTQDANVGTAGIQQAFIDWFESGTGGMVEIPPGSYLVNDELTAGVTSSGKTVAKHIKDGDLGSSEPPFTFAVKGEYKQSWIVVDETFSSSDSNFIDQAVIRYESPSKQINAPVIKNISFYAAISRQDRKKCPVAIKAININFSDIRGINARGEENEWPNTAVHIENVNNSYCENWRIKAGLQYTLADMWADGGGGRFDVVDNGSAVTGARIEANDASAPFANPSGETDAFWNDRWLLLGQGASTVADAVMVNTASSGAKVDDNTLDLNTTWAAPQNSAGINISFEMVWGAMSSGSNALTLEAGALDSDDEGRMVHVFRVGVSGDTEREVLSAYIQPGSISGDGKSCSLVHSDGSTAANAQTTRSRTHVLINPGIYIGQSAENIGDGHNNDTTFVGIHAEKCRGGAQMLLENVLGSHFLSGKAHGRAPTSADFDQQFSETGYLIVTDSCENVSFDNFLLSWVLALEGNSELVSGVRMFGDRNNVKFDNYEFFGAADVARLFRFSTTGSDTRFLIGSGLNNINNWSASANDRQVFETSAPHQIVVQGDMKLRETGGTEGHTDLLAPYRRQEYGPGQFVEIAGGVIDIIGSFAIVNTEGGASSDDLDTINGGRDGQVLFLTPQFASNAVTVKHNTGNILLPGNADIVLNQTRDILQLVFRGDNNEWYVVSSPADL